MKRKYCLLFLFFIAIGQVQAQNPDTCFIGVYINSMYDLKIKEGSFTSIFWLWRVYQNDSLNFADGLDIVNAKAYSSGKIFKDYKGNKIWASQKIKAEVKIDWKIHNFPFDKQQLSLIIEDADYDAETLVFKADKQNTKLDEDVKFKDWKITGFEITDNLKTYKTTYGDPTLSGSSNYSQVTVNIYLRRIGSWFTYFKILTGLFFAFAISLSVSLVPEKYFASRMPVCVGGLFSAVGSKYIAENIVPATNGYTLIDSIHNLTFFYILLCIVSSIVAMQKSVIKDAANARRWDVRTFVILLISYVLAVTIMTINAAN